MAQVPGIYIKDGIAVDTKLYLRGLYKACEQHGAQYVNKNIETLNDLADYDKIIVATGTGVTRYSELSHLKIYCLKGQLLKLEWPIGVHPLPMPLNGYVYIVMDREGKNCWAGATFERDFKSELPDEAQAKSLILPKLEAMYPLLRGVSVLGCEAGIRATTPDKKPIYGWVNDRVGFISGMGSKGLLYHALCAERMFGDGSA
jgi:glycine/D-amino acid oxidase-like deaminating enzyme